MLTDTNGTPHNFYFSGAMVCFCASKHTFRVPKRSHKGSGAKERGDKVVNISFSQESLDYILSPFCGKETFRIPAREVKDSECSARKLPDLKRSVFMCKLKKKQKGASGMVSFPQNHHQFAISYFPPNIEVSI